MCKGSNFSTIETNAFEFCTENIIILTTFYNLFGFFILFQIAVPLSLTMF